MMNAGNSKGGMQDSVSHKPQSQADEQINKVVTTDPLDPILKDSSTLACSFFPGPGKQGLPTEIRQMIYDEAVSFPWYHSKYRRILTMDHWIFYEETSQALALLRNGSVWENDACNAAKVKLAIRPFTLHASWETLQNPTPFTKRGFLVGLLKGLDVVFAMDQEHQRTSSIAPRKWTAPISPTVLKYGYLILRSFLMQERNPWTFKNNERENQWFQKESSGAFLQTAILDLRRSPVINIRIFVYTEYPPHSFYPIERRRWEASREFDSKLVEKHIRERLLIPLRRGMTSTRLPRSDKDGIRHHITLLAYESQFSYWKERLKCFDGEVHWEMVTKIGDRLIQDDSHVGPEEPESRYFGY